MDDKFLQSVIEDCCQSISNTQKLKSDILAQNLFPDPNERAEIMLLIDHILWEETHAAEQFRIERKQNLLAISNISESIQKREAGPQSIPGGGQDNLVDPMAERTRSGTPIPLFPESPNTDDRSKH